MDSSADITAQRAALDPPPRSRVLRVAVPAIVAVGAAAIAWAGWLAGGAAALACALATVAALALAAVWLARPRLGAALLTILGCVIAGIAGLGLLAGGTVPWLLVAFWGGSTVLLAALLDLVAGPGPQRFANVALIAVATLLVLSAVGLAAYVQQTWTAGERQTLGSLPILPKAQTALAEKLHIEPVTGGEWGARWWLRSGNPGGEFAKMRQRLVASGWTVSQTAPMLLLAHRGDYQLELSEQPAPESATAPAASGSPAGYSCEMNAHVYLAKGGPSAP